ncbi:CHAT domain-containing protein [bacterium]|nr:CHAT domain-containing protein [bacterium]
MIRLSWAEREVAAVAALARGRAYCGGRATESRFKREAPKAGILHIATHCVINEKNNADTGLILSPDSRSGEDGVLYMHEIYEMRFSADLAVLSACNTGSGVLAAGDGYLSLGRCFMLTGCNSALMSLWPVDDRSSSMLVAAYYDGLAAGRRKHAALRDAKLAWLKDADERTANPIYWAGMVQSGSVEPLRLKPSSSGARKGLAAAGGLAAAALTAGLAWTRMKRGCRNAKPGRRP